MHTQWAFVKEEFFSVSTKKNMEAKNCGQFIHFDAPSIGVIVIAIWRYPIVDMFVQIAYGGLQLSGI